MIWQDQDEITAIIDRMGPVILSTAPGSTSSEVRRLVGRLLASESAVTDSASFATEFTACLDEARKAGATWQSMGNVRLAALAEAPVSLSATIMVQAMVRLSLAQEARLITLLSFTSRDDVESVARTIGAAFEQAAEVAADSGQAGVYMAIVSLQSDVTKYLTDQGRLLPRVVQYRFAQSMPALAMSQRAYGTGSRSDELRLENKVVHPAFMPLDGRMLAV